MRELIKKILRENFVELHESSSTIRKWTKENVSKEAKKFQSKSQFCKYAVGACAAAKRYGWFDEVTSHMEIKKVNWSKEAIQKIANNYIHRSEFCNENKAACQAARRNGWYEEICSHMEPLGNKYNRLVYVFEFPDNHVYVGLTGNLKRREDSHMSKDDNSAVKLHMALTGLKPELKIISDDYIDYIDAQNLEGCTVEKYKSEGWKILNRTKTGGLGSCVRVWTIEMVKDIAKKYKSRTDLLNNEPLAYAAAARNGWLDSVFEKTPRLINPNNTWTYEVVKKESEKYNSKDDFAKGSPLAYNAARSKGWFEELTKNYTGGNIKWTEELLRKESKKYKSRTEFARQNNKAYMAATRKGLLDKLFPKK